MTTTTLCASESKWSRNCGEAGKLLSCRGRIGYSFFTVGELTLEIKTRKTIILVGDKVLIAPDADAERTNHGLYLPPGVKEKEKVNSGVIVQVGPGYAVPNPHFLDQEQWSTSPKDPIKYMPLQAEEGDFAVFLRDSGIEIEYDERKYLIVPHSAILMLIRRNEYVQGPEQ
jgi:co-chaperonin GroES (HSP10)